MDARVRAPVRAFTSLDAINLTDLFDAVSASHFERSVQNGVEGGLSGDSGWNGGKLRGQDRAWLETLFGVASDDVVPP